MISALYRLSAWFLVWALHGDRFLWDERPK